MSTPHTDSKAGTQFIYSGGMESWVDLGAWPGIEPKTAWLKVQHRNRCATSKQAILTCKWSHETYRHETFIISPPRHNMLSRHLVLFGFLSDPRCRLFRAVNSKGVWSSPEERRTEVASQCKQMRNDQQQDNVNQQKHGGRLARNTELRQCASLKGTHNVGRLSLQQHNLTTN